MINKHEKQRVPFQYQDAARLIILAGLVFFTVTNISGFLLLLMYLLGILVPVIIGILLAFALNLPMAWLEKNILSGTSPILRKIRRPVALLLSVFLVIGLLSLVVILVIPQSIQAIQTISQKMPEYYQSLLTYIETNTSNMTWLKGYVERMRDSAGQWGEGLLSSAGLMAGGLFRSVTGVLGGLINAVLGLSFAIFMLISKETLLRQIDSVLEAYMKPQRRAKFKYVLGVVGSTFRNYLAGQVTEAIVIGILTTGLMLLLRFPYATVIGPLTGLSSLIPMIGAFIGGGVGFLLILTVDPVQGLFFLLFIVVLQQVDGIFIYPRIVGNSVEMPPLWVFFAVTVGGALFGFAGTFLGVPALASVYRLLKENVHQRIKLLHEGALTKYLILKVPKGTESVRLNEPELNDLADPDVDTSDFL